MLEILAKDFAWLTKWFWRSITQRGMGEASWCSAMLTLHERIIQDVRDGLSRDQIISRHANHQLSLRMRFYIIQMIDMAIEKGNMSVEQYVGYQSNFVRSEFARFNAGNGIACSLSTKAI